MNLHPRLLDQLTLLLVRFFILSFIHSFSYSCSIYIYICKIICIDFQKIGFGHLSWPSYIELISISLLSQFNNAERVPLETELVLLCRLCFMQGLACTNPILPYRVIRKTRAKHVVALIFLFCFRFVFVCQSVGFFIFSHPVSLV